MRISVKTSARTELIDVTSEIQQIVDRQGWQNGFCFLYVPHTTAAITINESADPSVRQDIRMVINQVVPWNADYRHLEGNSPAHIKASLFGASEWVAVAQRRLVLGTWQGIFFCEFDGPRSRKLDIRFLAQTEA
jgi:secondary thiamine-phosphate synthase enzyme